MTARALDRAWRLVATAVSFALFGCCTVLLSLTVFPMLALVSASADRRSARVQWVLHCGCRLFVWIMKGLGLLTWEAQGLERLAGPGQMIVANHPSLIDVVFFLSWMPQADCIMKQSLARNPFLRWTVAWAGYIGNASPEGLIEDCARVLRSGRSLIVFPEGTRTVPGLAAPFKRGAARIALLSGAEILPVRIHCDPPTLMKHSRWWQIPPRPAHFSFSAGTPFRAADIAVVGETQAQAARRVTDHLQRLLLPLAVLSH
jgi:1-acyl-sn-glycerol-3-phosphate acyltransferase